MHHVVIVGGGFGGLYAAKSLRRSNVRVTLVDRRNFHLFQPLLYQVATGGLSPGDIASPLRAVLKQHRHLEVIQGEVVDIDTAEQTVQLEDGTSLAYDDLVVAVGMRPSYFGHDEWAAHAPSLKSVEDALEIRHRVFAAFERAERETDAARRQAWQRFVVVGGGPTGVELAGALAELAHGTLVGDFRRIDPRQTEVVLLEGADRVLPPYPASLSKKAAKALERLGVDILTGAMVENIDAAGVDYKRQDQTARLEARTVLWGAGMTAVPLAQTLAARTGAQTDRSGRLKVEADLTLKGHATIRVIGDLACFTHGRDAPLPGVAPVAMQQGRYVAKAIEARVKKCQIKPFRYTDKGNLAVIGRHAAVADLGFVRLSGGPAWFIWIFIHIAYLVGYDNKALVLFQWALNYLTRKRGARLITGRVDSGVDRGQGD